MDIYVSFNAELVTVNMSKAPRDVAGLLCFRAILERLTIDGILVLFPLEISLKYESLQIYGSQMLQFDRF